MKKSPKTLRTGAAALAALLMTLAAGLEMTVVRKLNPECGFVLMDKLEQMDLDTLQEFGEWLKDQGLQVIATRVSTGAECSIIIEDGMVKGTTDGIAPSKPKFTAGAF